MVSNYDLRELPTGFVVDFDINAASYWAVNFFEVLDELGDGSGAHDYFGWLFLVCTIDLSLDPPHLRLKKKQGSP
jgi:hypothetical protein